MKIRALPASLLAAASTLALAISCMQTAEAQNANAWPPPAVRRDQKIELAMKIKKPFTLAAVGDMLELMPIGQLDDPDVQYLLNIMRGADVTVANNENTIVDWDTFRGPIAHTQATPDVADDWKNIGIKIVTKANNHTWDDGEEGLWQDFRELDRVGIVHVGAGRDQTEARLARYLATPKGAVAAVGVYAQNQLVQGGGGRPVSVTPAQLADMRAARDSVVARRGEVNDPIMMPPPDPEGQVQSLGLNFQVGAATPAADDQARNETANRRGTITSKANVLNLTTYESVTAKQIAQLRAIVGDKGTGDTLTAFGINYKVGAKPGEYSYIMNPQDERDILREIRSGKQATEFEVAMIHWHQNRYAFQHYSFDHFPADFEIKFAHDAIDQGADAFVGHGVHTIKGIEIYKGKPIFYGVSNFVMQEEAFRSWRDDPTGEKPTPLTGPIVGDGEDNEVRWSWMQQKDNFEALLTTSHYENGKLTEVRIYPVDIGEPGPSGQAGLSRPGSELGIPKKASAAKALDILTRLQEYSKPFGTQIAIENGVGVIRISASQQ